MMHNTSLPNMTRINMYIKDFDDTGLIAFVKAFGDYNVVAYECPYDDRQEFVYKYTFVSSVDPDGNKFADDNYDDPRTKYQLITYKRFLCEIKGHDEGDTHDYVDVWNPPPERNYLNKDIPKILANLTNGNMKIQYYALHRGVVFERVLDNVVTFVSGNEGKKSQIQQLNGKYNLNIEYIDIDLPEIQGFAAEIAACKCKEAYDRLDCPVLIEDTSLCFNDLNGLPGPYIKWFMQSMSLFSIAKLAERSGLAQDSCLFAYMDNWLTEPMLFEGIVDGCICTPREREDFKPFGWDPIFIPNCSLNRTYAEMHPLEKNQVSGRALAFNKFAEWYANHILRV